MTSPKRLFALLLTMALCTGCASALDPAKDPAKLRSWMTHFKTQDPVAEATKNHQKGSIYIIGATGAGGSYYPGIGHEQGQRAHRGHGIKYLPATSDVIESDLHMKYMEAATAYAGKYNQTTLKLLGIPNEAKK